MSSTLTERTMYAKVLGGRDEQTQRSAADVAFAESQKDRLAKIGSTWKREEADRVEGWYALSRMVAEYVDAELAHGGSGRANYTAAVAKVEGCLSAYCENAKASVSRLLATDGLYKLMVVESEDDAAGIMSGLTLSAVKVLVRLVVRDHSAPGLSYQWKDAAVEKGPCLLATVSDQGMTVADLKDAVDAVLTATTERPAVSSSAAPVEGGRKRGRKASTPAAKAASQLGKVLSAASQASVRTDTVRQAVQSGVITTADLITGVGASTVARQLVIGSVTADEVASVAKQWIEVREVKSLLSAYKALRTELVRLLARRKRLKLNTSPRLHAPA